MRKAMYRTRRASQLFLEFMVKVFIAASYHPLAVSRQVFYSERYDSIAALHGDAVINQAESEGLDAHKLATYLLTLLPGSGGGEAGDEPLEQCELLLRRQRARRVRRVPVPGPPVERRLPRGAALLEVLLELAL